MARHKNGVDQEFLRRNLEICAAYGVGFFRDGGDKLMVSACARKIAWEYEIDYRTPVFAIYKKGSYGAMFGRAFERMADFSELVREAKALGADFIKLMVSGIMDFATDGRVTGPALGAAELSQAVHIAEGEGLAVMAHVNGAENIKKALTAGVKSIEHGFWPDREVVDIFCQTGAVWVPTRAPVQNLLGCGRFADDTLMTILETQKRSLIDAAARGVPIASGSDSGSYLVSQGRGLQEECESLAKMNIDPQRGNRMIAELFGKVHG